MASTPSSLQPTVFARAFYGWALFWGGLITVITTTGYLLSQLVVRRPSVFLWWTKCWAWSITAGLGIRVRSRRVGKLDDDSPYVFVSNHQILLDIPIVALVINRPFGFVAKGELARIPFLGAAIRCSPSVFVDRSNPRKTYESLKDAGEQIRKGTSVIIFPEGARSYEMGLGPFQKGAFSLALEAGVPIVPVTILDAYNVFNEKRKIARPGVVNLVIGEPISLSSYSRVDIPKLMRKVEEAIESQIHAGTKTVTEMDRHAGAPGLSDAIPSTGIFHVSGKTDP